MRLLLFVNVILVTTKHCLLEAHTGVLYVSPIITHRALINGHTLTGDDIGSRSLNSKHTPVKH